MKQNISEKNCTPPLDGFIDVNKIASDIKNDNRFRKKIAVDLEV